MALTARPLPDPSPPPTAEAAAAALGAARELTLALVAAVGDEDLERTHSPLMSPLVWDLAHIAAYEDLWLVHRYAGEPLLHPELAAVYDAFETPRAVRGDIELLRRAEAEAYMSSVRERATQVMRRLGVGDGVIHEMVVQHEHQHNETMLQTMCLARLPGLSAPHARAAPPGPGGHTGLETVEVAAGPFELGAPADRFSYDNERSRHRRDLDAFRIGRTPVTNATWLSFAEGGGYQRREWWTDEGWAWKEEYDIERPGGWLTDLDQVGASLPPADRAALHLRGRPVYEWRLDGSEPLVADKPVIHVSWFEADAFARAHGVRLPTEAEWEKAATWDQRTGATLRWPWRDGARRDRWGEGRANLLEQGVSGTAPVGAYPAGASPCGALGMIGDVWEWTASCFGPYPGFSAHPYREYSEVFFGDAYRVLRGGSWASSECVVTPTFRNWDLPRRRQLFAGVRVAADA